MTFVDPMHVPETPVNKIHSPITHDNDHSAQPEYEYDINEKNQTNYQIWKKNAKHLYDYLNTNTCRWPSLSVQIFPDIHESTLSRRLLLSQFTSGQIPQDEMVYLSSISTSIPWSSINNFEMDDMEFHVDSSTTPTTSTVSASSKSQRRKKNLDREIEIQFPVGEECNRSRYMFSNPDVIGSVSSRGSIYIHNKTKCLSNTVTTTPEFRLECASTSTTSTSQIDPDFESLSLAWNFQQEGVLSTCANEGSVFVWDLNKVYCKKEMSFFAGPMSQETCPSTSSYEYRVKVDPVGCNDVSWMVNHRNIVAAACETRGLQVLDTRRSGSETSASGSSISFHTDGNGGANGSSLNSVQFNWQNDMLLCTGSSTGSISIWDLRSLSTPLQTFIHDHKLGPISNVQWNPLLPNIIASAGLEDGLVKIWDTAPATPATPNSTTLTTEISLNTETLQNTHRESANSQDNENLIFTHGGHMLGCNDVAWDFHDQWLLASVSNDNSIHLWKPARRAIAAYYG
ncbi:hypothetical protein ACO0QE_002509 [Hanseniaspora vineae]